MRAARDALARRVIATSRLPVSLLERSHRTGTQDRMATRSSMSDEDWTFKRILDERQRAHLSRELLAIRDEVFAPSHLLKPGGASSSMFTELQAGIVEDREFEFSKTYRFMHFIASYVHDIAYGEAALRHKGLLPPVSQLFKGSATATLKHSLPDVATIRASLSADEIASLGADEKAKERALLSLQGTIYDMRKKYCESLECCRLASFCMLIQSRICV